MTLQMGPILRLQDCTDGTWRLTALVVALDATPVLRFRDADGGDWITADPNTLLARGDRQVLRYALDITLDTDNERRIEYTIDGAERNWTIQVPSANTSRLRAAFVSCNGFSSNKERRDANDPYNRWHDLARHHVNEEGEAFHLLIMGGDQVYADPIWEKKSTVEEWTRKDGDAKWKRAQFTRAMQKQVEDFYFDLYTDSWGQYSQDMQTALACIPTLMMWDDHDIFDGWGSYDDEKLDSPVYSGIYGVARHYFEVFQLQRDPDEIWPNHICPQETDNLTYGMTLGDVGVLMLDLRSERRRNRVITPASWEAIYEWIDKQKGLNHLIVVSSVPVVHVDLSAVEWITGIVDPIDLDDDLRDHWLSRAHKQERLRLIHRLFEFSSEQDTRVTLLSGDIHVAALGILEKTHDEDTGERGGSIYQIISSPIVHNPPPGVMRWFYDTRADAVEEVDRGITSRFVKMPASDIYYIGRRNWTALEIDTKRRRLWCNWNVEGTGDQPPYRHAINARRTRS